MALLVCIFCIWVGEHCFRGALERLVLLRTITMRAAHTHRAVVDRWNAGGALELLVCDTLPFTVTVWNTKLIELRAIIALNPSFFLRMKAYVTVGGASGILHKLLLPRFRCLPTRTNTQKNTVMRYKKNQRLNKSTSIAIAHVRNAHLR